MGQYFKDKYSIVITEEVMELSFGRVKKILAGVEKIIIEYPEIAEFINFIKITKFNFMHYDGNAIKLNRIYFDKGSLSLIKYCNEMSINGRWIKNCKPSSIGIHEAIHILEYLLVQMNTDYKCKRERVQAYNDYVEAKFIIDEAVAKIQKTPYGKDKNRNELITEISKYATENDSETLAEAFADVYTNKSKANPLSIEIRKVTKEKYKIHKNKNIMVKIGTS